MTFSPSNPKNTVVWIGLVRPVASSGTCPTGSKIANQKHVAWMGVDSSDSTSVSLSTGDRGSACSVVSILDGFFELSTLDGFSVLSTLDEV